MEVFISYSSHDARTAVEFAKHIRRLRHSVWLDKWEIHPGHSISQMVERGLEDSEFLILMVSNASIASGWVDKEWRNKFSGEATSKDVRIICVRLEDCQVPMLLRDKMYVDGFPDIRRAAREVSRAISKHRNDRFSEPILNTTRKVAESIGEHSPTVLIEMRETINGLKDSLSPEDLVQVLVKETEYRYAVARQNADKSEQYEDADYEPEKRAKKNRDAWNSITNVFIMKARMSAREHLEDLTEWKAILDHFASDPVLSWNAKLVYLLQQLESLIERRSS